MSINYRVIRPLSDKYNNNTNTSMIPVHTHILHVVVDKNMWRLDFAMYNKNTAYLLFAEKNKSKMILFFNGLVSECRQKLFV